MPQVVNQIIQWIAQTAIQSTIGVDTGEVYSLKFKTVPVHSNGGMMGLCLAVGYEKTQMDQTLPLFRKKTAKYQYSWRSCQLSEGLQFTVRGWILHPEPQPKHWHAKTANLSTKARTPKSPNLEHQVPCAKLLKEQESKPDKTVQTRLDADRT